MIATMRDLTADEFEKVSGGIKIAGSGGSGMASAGSGVGAMWGGLDWALAGVGKVVHAGQKN